MPIKKFDFLPFYVAKNEGEGPETAAAIVEGLAFANRRLRESGPEEAGRRRCLSFPANIRRMKAGKRVLSRRKRR
jgi:hypothetical protein